MAPTVNVKVTGAFGVCSGVARTLDLIPQPAMLTFVRTVQTLQSRLRARKMHLCLHVAEVVLNIVEKADEVPRDYDREDDIEETSDDRTSIFNIHGFFECSDKAKLRRDPVLSLALVCEALPLAVTYAWEGYRSHREVPPKSCMGSEVGAYSKFSDAT